MRKRTLIGAGLAVALAGAMLSYQSPVSAQPYGGPGMMGGGYGPGYGHMGGYGPGMMGGWHGGYGPGMMQGNGYGPGYGPGCDRRAEAQGNQSLNLTTDDVKSRVERWLARQGNPRLQLGEVKEKDADTITADVVTKDNSLVQRFIVDRHTGFIRQDDG